MKTLTMVRASLTLLACSLVVGGCGFGTDDEALGNTLDSSSPTEDMAEGLPIIRRDFWLSLAEEPGWHLEEARKSYMAGQARAAADELSKVASFLNFETRHAGSEEARSRLLSSVAELREVARLIRFQEENPWTAPSQGALNRVEARTFRAMGVHHLALSRESTEAGDPRMAARYIRESINDIEKGFARAGVEEGKVMESDLTRARAVAADLLANGDGDRVAVSEAIDRLEDAINGLGEVVGARRK